MPLLLARTVRALPVALALFAFPLRAEAQLSGLLKKAKEQIAKPDAVAPAKSTANASNAQIGDPFDAASLDAALKGMVVVKARQAELAALNKQYVDNQEKRTALVDKSARVIDEFEKKRESNDNCISQDISARTPEREAVAQQKAMAVMSDESTRDEYLKVATAMQGAVAKNDTASLRKLTASYMKMLGVDPQADSIIAFKKCGHPPALPAALARPSLPKLVTWSPTCSPGWPRAIPRWSATSMPESAPYVPVSPSIRIEPAMTQPNDQDPSVFGRVTEEVKGMGREGLSHPSTKPVLGGAVIGTVAAILLPVLTIPIGLIAGAGIALWLRIKR